MNYVANESLHALSGAYVVDALDDAERDMFEKHLPGCLDCQAEVASLREATALMADDAAITPPPGLRASVLAGISTIRPLAPETGSHSEPAEETELAKVLPMRRRGGRLTKMVAAAAAVAAIGAGIVYQPWQGNDSPPVAQLGPADQVLAASDAQHYSINFNDGSSASVVRSASEGKAVLLTRGMAAPPSGKVYELWLRDKAGVMKPAGLMSGGGDHKVLLKGKSATATGVGVTVEPLGGSDTPSQAPIAMFEFNRADA